MPDARGLCTVGPNVLRSTLQPPPGPGATAGSVADLGVPPSATELGRVHRCSREFRVIGSVCQTQWLSPTGCADHGTSPSPEPACRRSFRLSGRSPPNVILYSPSFAGTRRTVGSRISCEYCLGLPLALFSQFSEPPGNSGRFRSIP